jgi:hypothetical protein
LSDLYSFAGAASSNVKVDDYNRDGVSDLVGVRKADGVISVWTGNGAGGFNNAYAIGSGWDAYQDFTGVGDMRDNVGDLIGIRKTDGLIHIWTGTGSGGFNAPFTLGSGWNAYDLM